MGSVKARGVRICDAAARMLLCVVVLLAAAPALARPGDALEGDRTRTRFVIALEREASFQVSSLSQPNRVVVDLPDVRIGLPGRPTGNGGLVKDFRGGIASPGKVRVVIDVTDAVIVERAVLEPAKGQQGPRLVLDIVAADAADRAGKAKASLANARVGSVGLGHVQPPLPRPAQKPHTRAAKSFKPVIVLDPGHGGMDSGAQRNGAVEKEVVLAFSLVLRERLLATGRYNVLMTRDNDTFIPLDDRRDFAERNKAALFMAIHADYAGASASGATIYSLRDSVAQSLKRSAVGEVKQEVLSDKDLAEIRKTSAGGDDTGVVRGFLGDLAQREVEANKERTSVFARSMVEGLGETTNLMSNPDRSATYRVLKTAKVPAVLVELAYVSNKQDAANLKSQAWRRKVADSIVSAIDNYFSHQVARLPL